jgi:hypothetical protein
VPRPPIRGRTREEVLQALRRLDPKIREAALHAAIPKSSPDGPREPPPPLEAQIFPTELRLVFVYIPGAANNRDVHAVGHGVTVYQASW